MARSWDDDDLVQGELSVVYKEDARLIHIRHVLLYEMLGGWMVGCSFEGGQAYRFDLSLVNCLWGLLMWRGLIYGRFW